MADEFGFRVLDARRKVDVIQDELRRQIAILPGGVRDASAARAEAELGLHRIYTTRNRLETGSRHCCVLRCPSVQTEDAAGLTVTVQSKSTPTPEHPVSIDVHSLNFYYGAKRGAARTSRSSIQSNLVTAFIGPSGCGKSTFLRTLNRMNDIIPGARVEGTRRDRRQRHLRAAASTSSALRRRVGMVFQKSNPFPKSIFDNIAYGVRLNGLATAARELHGRVEESLQGGGALGRGEGSAARARRWRCPAASSSGCASRARSPSSPRSC